MEDLISSSKDELEKIIAFILSHNLLQKNKRRAFLLLLSLAPKKKFVSKYFIQDKIEEAFLLCFLPKNDYVKLGENYLDNIRDIFSELSKEGLIEKSDVSNYTQKNFQLFCKTWVIGSYFRSGPKRSQLFQKISCLGRKRVQDILSEKI